MVEVFAGILGLVIGSFMNVVVYRLPKGESLSTPGSHCPGCQTPIKPYDNVPVIGWLLLRGRCRSCQVKISARYPIVEAVSGALAVSVVLAEHSTRNTVLGLLLVATLVPVSLIDLDFKIIPNKILLPSAVAAIAAGAALNPSRLPEQLIAGAAAGGFLLLFALAYPKGMGMGDVKLAAVLGLYLGRSVAIAVLGGVVAALVAGMLVIARSDGHDGRKTAIPFGPFLALGAIFSLFAGPSIVHWYVHSVI